MSRCRWVFGVAVFLLMISSVSAVPTSLKLFDSNLGMAGNRIENLGNVTLSGNMGLTGARVGVGTSSPEGSSLLHVVNDSNAQVRVSNSSGKGGFLDATLNPGAITLGALGLTGDIVLRTNGANRMRVTDAGNVGIGTSGPLTPLHVVETGGETVAKFTEERQADNLVQVVEFSRGRNDGTPADGDRGFNTYKVENSAGAMTTAAEIRWELANVTDGSEDGELAFYTRSGGSAPAERMRIDANGSVGIGQASPQGGLDIHTGRLRMTANRGSTVSGDGAIAIYRDNGNLAPSGNPGSLVLQARSDSLSGGDSQIHFVTGANGGASRVTVDQNGNVGINTTSPASLLDVQGDVRVESTSDTASIFNIVNEEQDASVVRMGTDTGGHGLILLRKDNGVARTRIGADGDNYLRAGLAVGKTGAPSGIFEAQVSSGQGQAFFVNTNAYSGGSNGFDLNFAAGHTYARITGEANDSDPESEGGFLRFYTEDNTGTFSENMRIETDGNICGTDGAFESCSSDARLKQDVREIEYSLNDAVRLEPVRFRWNELAEETYNYPEGRQQIGFIAQQVEEVVPGWVSTDSEGYKKVEDGELRFLLLEALQELKEQKDAEIRELENEVEELRETVEEQNEENQQIKQLVCEDHPDADVCS